MDVLSHRGHWLAPDEKNTQRAFLRSFDAGFGTETDVRDRLGELVIAHDLATGGEMLFTDFLRLRAGHGLPLALNIKADGLAQRVHEAMRQAGHAAWFVFDMSVPDMRHHLQAGSPVYARMSEHERQPPWFERVQGVWLDAFDSPWFGADLVRDLLGQGKRVCVVSSELHGRDSAALWQALRPLASQPGLALCTDLPLDARGFFQET